MCYCSSSLAFEECCLVIHQNPSKATHPTHLMRARYSAFSVHNVDFLNQTSLSSTPLKIEDISHMYWLYLEVIDSGTNSLESQAQGWVEFKAYFKEQGTSTNEVGLLYERSCFLFDPFRGHWIYTDGQPIWSSIKMKRNDRCICQSGRKWKRCCGVQGIKKI